MTIADVIHKYNDDGRQIGIVMPAVVNCCQAMVLLYSSGVDDICKREAHRAFAESIGIDVKGRNFYYWNEFELERQEFIHDVEPEHIEKAIAIHEGKDALTSAF